MTSVEKCLVSYMYTIMKNRCLDYIKRRKIEIMYDTVHRQEYQYLTADSYALADESINLIIETEIKEALNKAIHNLPEKSREVFLKSRYEGKRYREIASEMGLSEKSVEFHMSRALTMLRKELSHLYFAVGLITWLN